MKYRINTYYTRRGIWLCYFTRKLYLHSPSARENTMLLVKYLAIFHSYSCNWRASEASETLFSHVYGNSR